MIKIVWNNSLIFARKQAIRIKLVGGEQVYKEAIKAIMLEVFEHTSLKPIFVPLLHGHDIAIDCSPQVGTDHMEVGQSNLLFEYTQVPNKLCTYPEIHKVEIPNLMERRECYANIPNNQHAVDFVDNEIAGLIKVARGNVLHETLHMLGALHEQHNPNSGIEWHNSHDYDETEKYSLDPDTYRWNEYDPQSITHYPSWAYEANVIGGASEVTRAIELSDGDIDWLRDTYKGRTTKYKVGLPEHFVTGVLPT